jgi:hypothetical protein
MGIMMKLVEVYLSHIEKILLDGEQSPYGKPYDPVESEAKLAISVPALIRTYSSYGVLKHLFGEKPKLLKRIFYLARDVDEDMDLKNAVNSTQKGLIHHIANQGRSLSLKTPRTIEQRVKTAKLFTHDNHFYGAQLKDPKRGCSSSVCSNCDEPIVYSDVKCKTCNYELIGAHGMPTIEEWEKMTSDLKILKMEEGFRHMVRDITCRGDWRDSESPLNRFKRTTIQWGGYSPLAGGAPLKKITGFE